MDSSITYTTKHLEHFKEMLKEKGVLNVNIVGRSMFPLIKEGSTLSIVPIGSYESIKKFDVIIFHDGHRLVCHYFWKRNMYFKNEEDLNNPVLVTRPLNPIHAFDHPINADQILGYVPDVKIGPYLKFKILWSIFFSEKI